MQPHPLAALPPVLRLGTRGSLLARTQSQLVADLLQPHLPPHTTIQLIIIKTTGDALSANANNSIANPPPTAAFDKGNFVKEIDEQLLAGKIDFAVHSAKDLPAVRPDGVVIAATPRRENPADVFINSDGLSIDQLPPHSKIGTASLRRQAQLLARRPDLVVVPLRGNIDTRLKKVAARTDGLAGTFLAAAGLLRTGLLPPNAMLLPTEEFIPAAGQGTLVIETRKGVVERTSNVPVDGPKAALNGARTSEGDGKADAILALLANLNDPLAGAALGFERQIVRLLGAGCLAPIGVCAEPRIPAKLSVSDNPESSAGGGWIARAIVASPDGKRAARCTLMAQTAHPPQAQSLHDLISLMHETLIRRGALEILQQCQS